MGIFAIQLPGDALKSDVSAALIEQTATMILLPGPNADKKDYISRLKLTGPEFQVIKSLDERSRCFLAKQGHASAVCQLSPRGFGDGLTVISASTDNINTMDGIIKKTAEHLGIGINTTRPENWLQTFYDERKGSGKKSVTNIIRNAG